MQGFFINSTPPALNSENRQGVKIFATMISFIVFSLFSFFPFIESVLKAFFQKIYSQRGRLNPPIKSLTWKYFTNQRLRLHWVSRQRSVSGINWSYKWIFPVLRESEVIQQSSIEEYKHNKIQFSKLAEFLHTPLDRVWLWGTNGCCLPGH